MAVANVGAHRRAAHGREPPFACDSCGFLFWTADKLAAHMTQLHAAPRPVCTICRAAFSAKEDLNAHLPTHAPTQMLFCPRCAEPCVGLDGVRAHMDETHPDDWVQCEACPEGESAYFAAAEFLEAHRLAVHVDRASLCEVCGHVSESQETNWWHRSKMHPTVYSIRCEACSMRFRTPANLRLHQKLVHEEEKKEGAKTDADMTDAGHDAGRYGCSGCSRTFGTHGAVKRHYAAKHAEHACMLCGSVFGKSSWLRWHEANCVVKLVAGCPFHIPEYVTW